MVRPWGREGFDPRQGRIDAGRVRDREGIEESDSGESGVDTSDFGGGDAPEGGGVVPERHSPRGEDGERDEDLQEGETFWFIAGNKMFISGHY